MAESITFGGPYSFFPNSENESIFSCSENYYNGIYLWTIKVENGYKVYYVGIAINSFINRFLSHLNLYYDGSYTIHDPNILQKSEKQILYSPSNNESKTINHYSKDLFVFLNSLSIFIGPIDKNKETLEKIESTIITDLKSYEKQNGFQILDNMRLSRSLSKDPSEEYKINITENILGLKSIILI